MLNALNLMHSTRFLRRVSVLARSNNSVFLPSVGFLLSASAFAHFATTNAQGSSEREQDVPKIALNPKDFRSFRVRSNEKLTHDTHKIRVDFPSEEHVAGLTVASFLLTKAKLNGKVVTRPYTPVSANSQKGYMDLVVKGYPTGLMSKHLCELQPGDKIEMKGPLVKFTYVPNSKKHIGMVAGGSGITPMLQVALEILRNPNDNTQVTLIFANNKEQDIILHEELEAYQYMYPNFKVLYCLNEPPAEWKGYTGFVSKDMIAAHMPKPETDNLVLVCGPPGMMTAISGGKAKDFTQGPIEGVLKELNYTSEMVFKF